MEQFRSQTMKQLRASNLYASLPSGRKKSTLGKTDLCILMAEHSHTTNNTEVRTMHVDLRHIIPIVETAYPGRWGCRSGVQFL